MSTGGKGDGRRPEAQPGAYARGYDAIQWNNSATAQREMGGSSRKVTNSRHSMIGEQKDGGATGATSPSRASGELSLVGSYRGVPVYAHDDMNPTTLHSIPLVPGHE